MKNHLMWPSLKHSDGFTLLELIVNIAIIGILAAIAIPAFNAFREKAKTAQARGDIRNIHFAIVQLEHDTGKWPGPNTAGKTANQEVWDLNLDDGGLRTAAAGFPNWNGPYYDGQVPKDPWGSNYFFDPDYYTSGTLGVGPKSAVVGSFGPNKEGKNKYDSDDIYLILPVE